jgi:hypothetical protein
VFSKGVADAGTSSIDAASILARMTDARGEQLYEARGGLALLQGLKVWPGSGKLETIDLFKGRARFDSGLDPGGVQTALRFLAGTPNESAAKP